MPHRDLPAGLGPNALGYELWMMAATAALIRSGDGDPLRRSAYLESMLLHARALSEFVLGRGRNTDLSLDDFASAWEPEPADAVARVRKGIDAIDKRLAHLTWARVEQPPVKWNFLAVADDLLVIAEGWARHLAEEEPELGRVFQAQVERARALLPPG
jgi:hypothetical protein